MCPLLCSGRFHLCLLSAEYQKSVLNFVKSFLCVYWDDYMVFILQLVKMCCITLIDFQILKNLCICGINPTWSWCLILYIYGWIRLWTLSKGILYLCSSGIWGLWLFCCCCCCCAFSWFGMSAGGLMAWVWVYLFLCSFSGSAPEEWVSSLLWVWQNFPVKTLGPEHFGGGRLSNTI